MKTCQQIINGFSKLLGKDTEIVLHDLKKGELVYIVNGYVTDRSIGYKMDSSTYEMILGMAGEEDDLIGYPSRSNGGRNLRASHIVIRDASGVPAALICINQDTSGWEAVRDMIDSMIARHSMSNREEVSDTSENYIQNVTRQVIMDAVERSKPANLESKEVKLSILWKLETKGVFSVKNSVPIVCSMLSISQATLYNYLREIRSRETFG